MSFLAPIPWLVKETPGVGTVQLITPLDGSWQYKKLSVLNGSLKKEKTIKITQPPLRIKLLILLNFY